MVITNISGEKIIYPEQKIVPVNILVRLKTASITFAKSALFTAVVSLIPILHFVLVPVGVIVTVLSTWSAWKRSFIFEDFEVHCPTCDHKAKMPVSGAQLPLRTFCINCRNMVYVNN